jgi:hypothetical protein
MTAASAVSSGQLGPRHPVDARVITRVSSHANATTTAVCAPITAIATKNARDADA